MAKEPLTVGQPIWMETTSSYFRDTREERKISEYQIVEANQSSAYAVAVERLDKFNEDPKKHSYMKRRVEQRTHSVKEDGLGSHFKLWLSPESFERNVAYNKEIQDIRKQAHERIEHLSLSQLKQIMSQIHDL